MKTLRRAGIAMAGGAVVLFGVVTLPVPGVPCCVIIPAGLMILALEFSWAQRWLDAFKRRAAALKEFGGEILTGLTGLGTRFTGLVSMASSVIPLVGRNPVNPVKVWRQSKLRLPNKVCC